MASAEGEVNTLKELALRPYNPADRAKVLEIKKKEVDEAKKKDPSLGEPRKGLALGMRTYECKQPGCKFTIRGAGPGVMRGHIIEKHPDQDAARQRKATAGHRARLAKLSPRKSGPKPPKKSSRSEYMKQYRRDKKATTKVLPRSNGTKAERREYQRIWRQKSNSNSRRNDQRRAGAAALRTAPTNENGKHPPYPFKFCPDCGHNMPTTMANGKEIPRACCFCPDCGYQIPLMG